MLQAARANLERIDHPGPIECVLADGGYWNHDQIAQLGVDGTLLVLPTHDPHTRARRRARLQGPEAERIQTLLDTKPTRQITCFTRRGLPAVQAEWSLIAATHNLLKLFRYTPATA